MKKDTKRVRVIENSKLYICSLGKRKTSKKNIRGKTERERVKRGS